MFYILAVVGGFVNCIGDNKRKQTAAKTLRGMVLYFMYTPLLVIIHIPNTQKWAGGFIEPSRYGRACKYIHLKIYTIL